MTKRITTCFPWMVVLISLQFAASAQETTPLQEEAIAHVKNLAAAKMELAAALKLVEDSPTALAAVPQIEAAWNKVVAEMDGGRKFLEQHGAVFEHNDERFMESRMALLKAEDACDVELERLDLHRGLPAEFWNVVLPGLMREEIIRYSTPTQLAKPGGAELVVVLKTQLELTQKHQPAHVLTLVVRGCGPQTQPEVKKWLTRSIGAATMHDNSSPDEPGTLRYFAGPVDDVKKLADTIRFGEVARVDAVRGYVEVKAELAEVDEVMRAADDPAAFESLKAKVTREADVNSPDYHAQLADLLGDSMAMNHDEAIETLLAMNPDDVKDKKVRGAIARGFRELALKPSVHGKAGVEGVVKWGGKHSVPILIEILAHADILPTDQAVYDGLAKYPTADGAEAVADRLSHMSDREKAKSCLMTMGPVAEAAVIKVAPVDDLEINLFALEFLKTHGTVKCVALLRRAGKSSNDSIKSAGSEALREVQSRHPDGGKKSAKKPAA